MTAILADLPAEVLRIITSYFGCSTLRLARSGDKRLCTKLSCGGGVVSVILEDSSPRSVSRYPHILDNFVWLYKLSISRGKAPLCGPILLWKHLSKLVLLEDLDLTCFEAEEWLLSQEELFPTLNVSFDKKRPVSPSDNRPSRCMPFGTTFPRLQSLSLAAEKSVLIDSDLAHFPPLLTSLKLLRSRTLTLACLAHYPGKLLTSALWGDHMSQTQKKLFDYVPEQIQTLDISRHLIFYSAPFPWKSLTSLKICTDDFSLRHLPTSLTALDWKPSMGPCCGLPVTLSFPYLTSLCISTHRIDFSQPLAFPPALTSLKLETSLHPTSSCQQPFLKLPSGLHTLHITLSPKFPYLCLGEGIPSLTALELKPNQQVELPLLFNILPPSLKSLVLLDPRSSHEEGELPLQQPISSFPAALVTLVLPPTTMISCSQFEWLPATLTDFDCHTIGNWTVESAKFLPRFLARLSIQSDLNSQISVEGEFVMHLPPRMRELTLLGPIRWTAKKISFLSRELQSLDIDGSSLLDDAISSLPPLLSLFSYKGANPPSGECFKFLPRNLRYLFLFSATNISDADIVHIPRYVKHLAFSVDAAPVSKKCVDFLPPSLSFFTGPDEIVKNVVRLDSQMDCAPASAIDPRIFKNSPSALNDWY